MSSENTSVIFYSKYQSAECLKLLGCYFEITCSSKQVVDALASVDSMSKYRQKLSELTFDEYCEVARIIDRIADDKLLKKITEEAYTNFVDYNRPFKIVLNRMALSMHSRREDLIISFPDGLLNDCNLSWRIFDTDDKHGSFIMDEYRSTHNKYYGYCLPTCKEFKFANPKKNSEEITINLGTYYKIISIRMILRDRIYGTVTDFDVEFY